MTEAKPTTKYRVTLTAEERADLERMTRTGTAAAATLAPAGVLLLAAAGVGGPGWPDADVRAAVGLGKSAVCGIRERFVEQGLEAALCRKRPDRVYARKLDGRAEAHLVALACSKPPEGRATWTMQLLADRMVVLGHVDAVSDETVRQTLKKTRSSRG